MRRLVVAALTLAALAGCGSSDSSDIEGVFKAYTGALGRGDYAGGCPYLAPETVTKLRTNLQKLTGRAPGGCEDAMRTLYGKLDDQERGRMQGVARSMRIEKIDVSGDAAVIDWSSRYDGRRVEISQSARRIGGDWKLVDVSN